MSLRQDSFIKDCKIHLSKTCDMTHNCSVVMRWQCGGLRHKVYVYKSTSNAFLFSSYHTKTVRERLIWCPHYYGVNYRFNDLQPDQLPLNDSFLCVPWLLMHKAAVLFKVLPVAKTVNQSFLLLKLCECRYRQSLCVIQRSGQFPASHGQFWWSLFSLLSIRHIFIHLINAIRVRIKSYFIKQCVLDHDIIYDPWTPRG